MTDGDLVTAWMQGGVAGRVYLVVLSIATESGQLFQIPIRMPIDPALAVYPLPDPPTTDFGPAVSWGTPPQVGSLDFSQAINSGLASLL